VLIVDDDDAVRDLIAATLRAAGFMVHTASNGREAVTLFEQEPADLVITDLVMPEKDGIEIVLALRRAHPRVPIIAMSGQSTHSPLYLALAQRLGARRTLEKPFTLKSLIGAVQEVLAETSGAPPATEPP
jgi:DNA-binding response OmpR family regulator